MEFGIASRARAAAMGMREYNAEATIKSYYGLVVMQPYGKGATNDKEECCTPNAEAIYMSRTIGAELPVAGGEPLISTRALRADIASNIIVLGGRSVYTLPSDPITGRPTVPTDWGRILLPTDNRDGCKVPQSDDEVVIGPTTTGCSDCLNNNDEDTDIIIFTIDGKLVATLPNQTAKRLNQKSMPSSVALLARDRLRRSGMTSGLYLLSYIDRSDTDHAVRKTTKIMYVK